MEDKDKLVQQIAQNVRAIRMSRQLTQKQVAKGMGVLESLYVRLEKGTERTSIITIYKAAQFFGVDIDELVYGHKVQSKTNELTYKKKSLEEKLAEIEGLDPEEKSMALKLMDLALSKKHIRELNDVVKSIQKRTSK